MIRLHHVAKEYPRTGVALSHLTFQIKKGEFVFLTGPSGAGKTTLLKLLLMEEKPTEGEVWVSGVSAKKARRRDVSHLRRRLGVIFQDFRLLEDRTAEANVRFALEVTGAPRSAFGQKVSRALSQVGLASKGTELSARAFRRRAAAGGDCAGARQRSVRDSRRRADGQSRRARDTRSLSAAKGHQRIRNGGRDGDARSRSRAGNAITG